MATVSAGQALLMMGALTGVGVALAWPVHRDGRGMPMKGGAGAPCCRSWIQNLLLGNPEVEASKYIQDRNMPK